MFQAHPYPDDINPDRFVAKIAFSNDLELAKNLASINFIPDVQQTLGETYRIYNEHFSAGWVFINNIPVYLEVNRLLKSIIITVSGTSEDPYSLNDETFLKTFNIEQYLSTKNLNFVDPSDGDKYCLTPELYPELWKEV